MAAKNVVVVAIVEAVAEVAETVVTERSWNCCIGELLLRQKMSSGLGNCEM